MKRFDNAVIEGKVGENFDEAFSPFIQNVMQSHELPGLALGIVADNEIIYARGFGVRSIETGEPVSNTTIFHLASISKPFVATGIVQLVEQGKIELDTPILTYLPYFKLDDERYPEITIRQMLCHVAGMPDEEDYEWDQPQYDEGALERYVRSLSHRKLLSNPGEKFAYSNIAFECLGDVIAKVSGMSFDDYVKEHILNPAGMTESSFLMPAQLSEHWAAPHVRLLENLAWTGYPYNRMHGPSSTLHSNALEMCNWAITNLNRGQFNGTRILNLDSYDLLWKPQAKRGEDEYVGLSWFLGEYRGEKTVRHGGGDTGFRSQLVLLPDKLAAVVVLCNLIPASVEKIAYSAIDVLLGHEPTAIVPGADLLVFKTLKTSGLEAAVAHWNALKTDHLQDYDFSLSPFGSLYEAMSMNTIRDAESMACFYARVLPETDLKAIEDVFSPLESSAAQAIVRTIRER